MPPVMGDYQQNIADKEHELQVVDIGKYASKILSDQDRPLFDDAVKAAKVGALRAAYVMIWLACAESLKRRFREAQTRDHTAGKIVGEIDDMERQHKAVDRFLLDKALEYGFVSDSAHATLSQVYELRNIYGHPYQEAPSKEKVMDAAATVVQHVLSKTVRLRQGFGKQMLEALLADRNYLDDYEPTVMTFAKTIVQRLDESIHAWLLDEYWKELERMSDDSSMGVFVRRGMWFCRTLLLEVDVATFTHDDWHNRCTQFPKTMIGMCSNADIFEKIGERAQDSLVGLILEESETRASVLLNLEKLNDEDALSCRQQERFIGAVSDFPTSTILASGLSTKTCYTRLIDALESHNWYTQNPAVDMIAMNGPDQAIKLTNEQQVNLGRNILQAAEGTAARAVEFLAKLASDTTQWPVGVVRGIALESFVNESDQVRIKARNLNYVLSMLAKLSSIQRDEIMGQIEASVNAGTVKYWSYTDEVGGVICSLHAHEWSVPLAKALEAKASAEETMEA